MNSPFPPVGRSLWAATVVLIATFTGLPFASANWQFPSATTRVFNVRDYGAVGDGVTDDTAAIKAAFTAANQWNDIIYVPDGTYLVSDTISWQYYRTLWGQSRQNTIIRLKDNATGFNSAASANKAVIRCHYNNNQSIRNYVLNLTIHTGSQNPKAIGLRFNGHNEASVEDVNITSGDGAGAVGLDLAENEFGPALVRNVKVTGFAVGIKTPGLPTNVVLEHVELQGQSSFGVEVNFPVSARKIVSTNSVPAFKIGTGALAQLVLVDSQLNGGSSANVAIQNAAGGLYARNVTTSGYSKALDASGFSGSTVTEFRSGVVRESWTDCPDSHANLPVEEVPAKFEEPVSNWTIVGTALELEAAMNIGAKTIYIKPGRYTLTNTLEIPAVVERIIGPNARIVGHPTNFPVSKPLIRINGTTSKPLSLEWINVLRFDGTNPVLHGTAFEINSARTVLFHHAKGSYYAVTRTASGAAGGKAHLLDSTSQCIDVSGNYSVWMRHWNPEHNPFGSLTFIPNYLLNNGAKVWILGLKTESPSCHTVTRNNGTTEILGGYYRDHVGYSGTYYDRTWDITGLGFTAPSAVPYHVTVDARTSATYFSYAHASGYVRALHSVERRGTEQRELTLSTGNQKVMLLSAGVAAARLQPVDVILNDADPQVTYVGTWQSSTNAGSWNGDYRHDQNAGKGTKTASFAPTLPASGAYEVFVYHTASTTWDTAAPYDVAHNGGTTTVTVNQQTNGTSWVSLGTFNFTAGTNGTVTLKNANTTKHVQADCVRYFKEGTVPDIRMDNSDPAVTLVGSWTSSTGSKGFFGTNYVHDSNTGKGAKSATFRPTLPETGKYEVFVWHASSTTFSTAVPVSIAHSAGTTDLTVNQQQPGRYWKSIGVFDFAAGTNGSVVISTTGTTATVQVDGVRFLRRADLN